MNRAQAVPEITVENDGKRVTVRLSLGRERFFRRSRLSRSARFTARLPSTFSGEITGRGDDVVGKANGGGVPVEIRTTSGDITLQAR